MFLQRFTDSLTNKKGCTPHEVHPLIELLIILIPAGIANLLVFHVVVADGKVTVGSILELRIEEIEASAVAPAEIRFSVLK